MFRGMADTSVYQCISYLFRSSELLKRTGTHHEITTRTECSRQCQDNTKPVCNGPHCHAHLRSSPRSARIAYGSASTLFVTADPSPPCSCRSSDPSRLHALSPCTRERCTAQQTSCSQALPHQSNLSLLKHPYKPNELIRVDHASSSHRRLWRPSQSEVPHTQSPKPQTPQPAGVSPH